MSKKKEMTGRDFEALPDAEKERIFRELDNLTTAQVRAGRSLTAKEKRAEFGPPTKKGGRPKLGKAGTQIISISVEKSLLREVNAYAKTKGVKRSELFVKGVLSLIGAGK
jgi:hypothetical protein